MTDEEKKHEEEEEDLKKKDCPLLPTDWVMFLSDKINTKETSQSAFITMIITIVLALLAVMAGSIYAFMNMNTELALMVSSSLIKFWSLILCAILGLIIFLIFIPEITKKKVKPLKEIVEDIIDGEKDSNKIRERWEKIDSVIRKREEKLVSRKSGEVKMDKEKNDLEENDCPLSPKDWITFLSSESHKRTEIALVLLAIFIATYAAASIENLSPQILSFFVIMSYLVFILLTCFLIKTVVLSFRMDKIIEEILYEKLTDSKEIRKRWNRGKKIL